MRFIVIFLFFCLVYSVSSRNTVKATESMGQEVIEMGAVKDLPQGLEEEPSAEVDEDDEDTTPTTFQPATRKDVKKTGNQTGDARRRNKDTDKLNRAQEDEESRIEKELAEIYKDNVDYKADSVEVSKEVVNNTVEEKPIARSKTNFKFQPDGNNVERWRTSVDEITCDRSFTKRLVLPNVPKSSFRFTSNLMLLLLLSTIGVCCKNVPFYN